MTASPSVALWDSVKIFALWLLIEGRVSMYSFLKANIRCVVMLIPHFCLLQLVFLFFAKMRQTVCSLLHVLFQ